MTANNENIPEYGLKKHVLCLDDDVQVLKSIKMLLEQLGYRASPFSEPRIALTAISETPNDFDLLILDYNMPEVSGLEVARKVRAMGLTVPIALTSGLVNAKLQQHKEDGLVQALIDKPFTVKTFSHVIRQLIGQ